MARTFNRNNPRTLIGARPLPYVGGGFGMYFGTGFNTPVGSVGGGGDPPVTPPTPPASPSLGTASTAIFSGDSITAGSNASSAANRWVNRVATALSLTLTNDGISGARLQNRNEITGSPSANNFRATHSPRVMGANKKTWAYIAYGYNDGRYSGAPATMNVTNFEIDYRSVLASLIMGGYDPQKIVIVAPYYVSNAGLTATFGDGSVGSNTRAQFEAYVAVAQALAREFGTFYYDPYAYMLANGGASLIDTDNIHPTDTGHNVIATGLLANATVLNTYVRVAGLTATSPSAGALNVSWTADASAVSYTVKIEGQGSLVFGSTQTVLTNSYNFSGLTDGGYRVKVRANYSDGSSTPWTFLARAVAVNAFLSASFTVGADTAIGSYTPDIGGAFTADANAATVLTATGNVQGSSAASTTLVKNAASPPSANYTVRAKASRTVTSSSYSGVMARYVDTSNYYSLFYDDAVAGGSFSLAKAVGGSATTLATVAYSLPVNTPKEIELRVTGNVLEAIIDGALLFSVIDASLGSAGKAGFRVRQNGRIDDLSAF